jgi:hypothetical protein
MLAESHSILNRWKKYFPQLFSVHNVNNIRQIEVHTAQPSVRVPSHLEVHASIAKLRKYKSTGSDKIMADLFQAGGQILRNMIPNPPNFIWIKEELLDNWNGFIIVPVHKNDYKIGCNNYLEIPLLSNSYKSYCISLFF